MKGEDNLRIFILKAGGKDNFFLTNKQGEKVWGGRKWFSLPATCAQNEGEGPAEGKERREGNLNKSQLVEERLREGEEGRGVDRDF